VNTTTDFELAGVLAALLPRVLGRQGQGVVVKDAATGRIVYADEAFGALLRVDAAALAGKTDAELFDGPTAAALRAADQTALSQTLPLASEHAFERAGARCEFNVLRVPIAAPSGRRFLCGVWADPRGRREREQQLRSALTQLEQQQLANAQLRRELAAGALHDAASGLHGRPHFDDQLRREIDLSQREHREFAVVMIEIDPVPGCDPAAQVRVHEAMGRLLRGGTRAMDASCRLEADRFAVLLSGVGLATAHSRMESLRRQCATQIVMLDGAELRFSVAMGVASFPHTAQTREQLLASGEAALQQARQRGGNQVVLASIRFESS
jgi:diguanylate cyclase (GGDEF)-like protein